MISDFLNSRPFALQTRQRYRRVLELFLSDYPRDITLGQFGDWVAKQGGLNSQWIALNAVKGYLRFMFGGSHPALALRIPRAPVPPRRGLNTSEMQLLLASFDTTTSRGRRDLAMCGVFLDCALRVSEVARLAMEYVDLNSRCLDVVVKGGKWGHRVYSEHTCIWLSAWLNDRQHLLGKEGVPNVFISMGGNTPGQALTTDGVRQVVKRWRRDTGITRLHPHLLRHTYATSTTRAGAPQRVSMLGGGWASEGVFKRYTQDLSEEDLRPYFPTSTAMVLR